jgi:hypothetical protein
MNTSRMPGITAGTVIGGRYTVESLLGRGGMASVYRATDVPLGRSVALKIFSIDTEGSEQLGRESSEIQLLASLNHHALVTLFDASNDRGEGVDQSYLVMELVDGPTLKERIDEGPVGEIDAAQMLVDLGEALHVVHSNGVVHRDVKPANILLSPSMSRLIEFRAKLSDFGIAYLIDSTRLTMPGTIIGTAAYLSPEQARGIAPGPASDIYSLGLVTLEALTTARAFEGSMIESLSARLVSDPLIPHTLGPAWGSLLARMTARDPDARPSALEVAEAAREIEREAYAASTGDTAVIGSVGATGQTEALGATAALGQTATLGQTAAVDPPTRVMSAPSNDDATTVLPGPVDTASSAEARAESSATTTRRPLGRILVIFAAALVALGIGGYLLSTANAGDSASPDPVPTLPANDGELGTHLDELLESVTP